MGYYEARGRSQWTGLTQACLDRSMVARVASGHAWRRLARSSGGWSSAALGALYVALYPSMSSMLDEYMQNAPESHAPVHR